MNVSIRPIQGQEMWDTLFSLSQYAFHPSPPFENKETWVEQRRSRKGVTCYAVFEGDAPVTVVASTPMTQNLRGALYPASGVWGVSSHPSARRKGYVRQAMASLLAAERESGKAFTNLYPFRESFYERLGYVSYPLVKIAKFSPSALSPLLKLDLGGEIEMKMIGEAYETYRQCLMDIRQTCHGMGVFDFGDQAVADRNSAWVATARFGGSIEGLMLYSLQGEHATQFNFVALRFYYQSSRARYLLLAWIARHIDQADRAELWLPPYETPETWLADMQVTLESAKRSPMGRVLDVARIGGMQVGEGSFTAQIIDPLCPWNQGTWHFESCGGKLVVTKTATAGCELSIQGLSGLVAGTHDPEDFALRGWGSPDLALQANMRILFPAQCPHLHESF